MPSGFSSKTGLPVRLGIKLSEGTKEKIRLASKRRMSVPENRRKIGTSVRSYFQLHPDVSALLSGKRRKTALEHGFGKWMKGRKHPETTKERMRSSSRRGPNHYRWIRERSAVLEKHRIRGSWEWKEWRTAVFKRDGYTCQECKAKGGYLEPHHIVPIRLSGELFNTSNGITLCRPCHLLTLGKEMDHSQRYSAMVSSQM